MSVQRFCPLCDRTFQEGEAVLRCEGCSVLHHPGCWVTNGGCATEAEHRVAPAAMAYSSLERPSGSQAPHPGEGTRMAPLPAQNEEPLPDPIPFRGQRAAPQAPAPPAPVAEPPMIGGPVIGGPAPAGSGQPMIRRTLPSTVGVPASTTARRYRPPVEEPVGRRKMPEIYDRNRIFGYWYVPAAILVAVAVAVGVVWLAGALFGGDDEDGTPAQGQTPAPTTGGSAPVTQQPSAQASPGQGTATPTTATGAGKFRSGDTLLVVNTGDCLNVRVSAGRSNDAIVCVKDGTELTVTGGPESADELTWWKVRTALGEGWAAEDYLVKKE